MSLTAMQMPLLMIFSLVANCLGVLVMFFSTLNSKLFSRGGAESRGMGRSCGLTGLVVALLVLILSMGNGSRNSALFLPVGMRSLALLVGGILWALGLVAAIAMMPFQKTFRDLRSARRRNCVWAFLMTVLHLAAYYVISA